MEGSSKGECEREAENERGKTRPVVTAQTETWGPTERGEGEGPLPPVWELELGVCQPHWAGGEALLLASKSLHHGTQSTEANSSLGSTPSL